MIDNIDEKLRQAQIAKDKDDMVKHAEKTRQAAINLMKADNVSETPEIKANGRKVKFLDPDNLKMVVDGEIRKELRISQRRKLRISLLLERYQLYVESYLLLLNLPRQGSIQWGRCFMDFGHLCKEQCKDK